MSYKLNMDQTVAVDLSNEWRPMYLCPLAVKVQLLGPGGVPCYANWDGKDRQWQGWCPLPRKPTWMKEGVDRYDN